MSHLTQRMRKKIEGWKPAMTVEVRVRDLRALVDELERLEAAELRAFCIAAGGGISAEDDDE